MYRPGDGSGRGLTQEEQEANAFRLAACWNACIGINPEAVPELVDFAKRTEAAIGFLVAALPTNHAVAKDLIGLREFARSAIAKAKGHE